MNILVCGDRSWSAPDIIRQTIAIYDRDKDIIYHELESGAATYGMGIGKELGFETHVYDKNLHSIHLVLAFHNFIRNSKRTWFVIKEARALKIPYRVINSKNEVTDMSKD
jgi:hypothetical protein